MQRNIALFTVITIALAALISSGGLAQDELSEPAAATQTNSQKPLVRQRDQDQSRSFYVPKTTQQKRQWIRELEFQAQQLTKAGEQTRGEALLFKAARLARTKPLNEVNQRAFNRTLDQGDIRESDLWLTQIKQEHTGPAQVLDTMTSFIRDSDQSDREKEELSKRAMQFVKDVQQNRRNRQRPNTGRNDEQTLEKLHHTNRNFQTAHDLIVHLNSAGTCSTCHDKSAESLIANAFQNRDKTQFPSRTKSQQRLDPETRQLTHKINHLRQAAENL